MQWIKKKSATAIKPLTGEVSNFAYLVSPMKGAY